MGLEDITIHTAWTVIEKEIGAEVEGERPTELIDGPAFPCFLQIPGARESTRPGREVKSPLLLLTGLDSDGVAFTLSGTDRVIIEAPELGVTPRKEDGTRDVWQIDGTPAPLAPPGELIGYEARLKRVSD